MLIFFSGFLNRLEQIHSVGFSAGWMEMPSPNNRGQVHSRPDLTDLYWDKMRFCLECNQHLLGITGLEFNRFKID